MVALANLTSSPTFNMMVPSLNVVRTSLVLLHIQFAILCLRVEKNGRVRGRVVIKMDILDEPHQGVAGGGAHSG